MLEPLERLAAANPEPACLPPSLEEVWRRIEATEGMDADELQPGARTVRQTPLRARKAGSIVALAVSIAVVAVVAAAIGLLSHGSGATRTGSPGPRALIAKLAVLRRPQSAADKLPAHIHVVPSSGTIIPRFTRLVYSSGATRLYVVVVTPATHDVFWSPRDGDQVAVIAVAGGWGDESVPIPAVDLSNADEVQILNARTTGRPRIRPSAFKRLRAYSYEVSVVPDGVTHVRWTSLAGNSTAHRVSETDPHNNVAIVQGGTGLLVRASWYGSNGAVIPTSDKASLEAQRERRAPQIAQTIRYDELHSPKPSAAALADFAVFAVTSRTGVRMANGDIVSHPTLAELPWAILVGGLADPQRAGPARAIANFGAPDPLDIRQVITPSGARLYVIPTDSGLCLDSLEQSPLAEGLGSGGGGTCGPLAQVASHGLGMSSGSFDTTTTYRIVPKTVHSIVVRGRNGVRRSVAVPDGIYVHLAHNRVGKPIPHPPDVPHQRIGAGIG
jgi:hypothetical protein